jgi:hypothetical protein
MILAAAAFVQSKITKPGMYSYTVPKGYLSRPTPGKDFVFVRSDKAVGVILIVSIKRDYKDNKQLLSSWKADLNDSEPGKQPLKVHSTETITVGGKKVISALVSLDREGTVVFQRQVMALHKGHCVTLIGSYGADTKRQDREFLASLSSWKWL